jgi:hypothetical protein
LRKFDFVDHLWSGGCQGKEGAQSENGLHGAEEGAECGEIGSYLGVLAFYVCPASTICARNYNILIAGFKVRI